MSFYITLRSNGSTDTYPLNNGGDFTNGLNKPLNLSNDWEVGLAEIIYTNTANYIAPSKIYLKLRGTDENNDLATVQMIVLIPGSYYTSVEALLKIINDQLKQTFRLRLRYQRGKITFGPMRMGEKVHFSEHVQDILGIRNFRKIKHKDDGLQILLEGTESPRDKIGTLYVYSDLIKYNQVGDIQAPLMRTVAVRGKPDETTNVEFKNILYFPPNVLKPNKITISVRDSFGKKVISKADVSLVLHFKRK